MIAPQAASPVRRYEPQPLLALAFLGSGAPLVVSILTGVSLRYTLLVSAAVATVIVAVKYSRAGQYNRAVIVTTLLTGVTAGLAATLAYDAARLLLVKLGQMRFYPFETFNRFGELLIGFNWPRSVNMTVGTGYHFLNGIAFTTSYCFLLGGRRWYYGVLWGLGLEVLMFTTYTNWLDLEEVMGEFVAVSLVGHIVYGATFGLISQHWLSPERLRRLGQDATGAGR
jgi:hypothetical protein